MVTSEHPGEPTEPLGARDVLAMINQRIDDINARIGQVNDRIDDLRKDITARFRLLMWGIAIGYASILAILGALLARDGRAVGLRLDSMPM